MGLELYKEEEEVLWPVDLSAGVEVRGTMYDVQCTSYDVRAEL